MFPFIIRRLVQAIPTLIGATLIIFFIIQAAPGDFVTAQQLTPNITAQQLANLRHNFGLDRPVYQQYFIWLWSMIHGDFGLSFSYKQDVSTIMWPRIVNSLWLVLLNTIIFYALAIPLGIFGAVRQNSFMDRFFNVILYFLLGFPSFFLAILTIFGIVELGYATGLQLPFIGMTSANYDSLNFIGKVWDIFQHIWIPALILAISSIAGFSRYLRALMLEALSSDYIRTARSKGLNQRTVVYKHTFRNAIIPFVANFGSILPSLIAGAGFVEVVFSYPGITPMLLNALNTDDLYLSAGFLVISTFLLIVGNIVGDILLVAVDPRISYS